MTTGYRIGDFGDVALEVGRLAAQANAVGPMEDAALVALGLPDQGLALDLGCGPGFVANRMRVLRPNLGIVGVDRDSEVLVHARQSFPCLRAEACDLPFASDAFDVALARLVLRHVRHPQRVVSELVRVVRRRGLVIIEDCDDGSLVLEPTPAGFERVLAARHASLRRRGAEPHLARRLPALLSTGGLDDIAVRAIVVHSADIGADAFARIALRPAAEAIDPDLIAAEELARARHAIETWSESPSAFGMTTLLLVRGVKP